MSRAPVTVQSLIRFAGKAAADKISESARAGVMPSKEEVGSHVGKVLLASLAEAISADDYDAEIEKAPDTERDTIETNGEEVS